MFFRTNAVRGASVIKVLSGDTVVGEYKRERMAPGEMEKIVLPAAKLKALSADITVSVESL